MSSELELKFLLRTRLEKVEEEIAAIKSENDRLASVEEELRAVKGELTTLKLENTTLKAVRQDIQDQVDFVYHCEGKCLDIVDTSTKNPRTVEDLESDLQGVDVSRSDRILPEVGRAQSDEPTVEPSTSDDFIDFGAVFLERMDEIQACVLERVHGMESVVVKRMDGIEAAVQSKLEQAEKGDDLIPGPVEEKIDSLMLVNIAKKLEDFLEHSLAVVSCEAKLENIEKILKRQETRIKSMESAVDVVNQLNTRSFREEERFDRLEQQIVAFSNTILHVSQPQHGSNIKSGTGTDKLVTMVSKLGLAMDTFESTLRNVSVSDASLQNILQWVQSMNSKIVDLSAKIDGQSGRGSLQKAISSLATKADLQFMAAILQDTNQGKETKKGGSGFQGAHQPPVVMSNKPKLLTAPVQQAGPGKPEVGSAAVQRQQEAEKSTYAAGHAQSPAVPSGLRSLRQCLRREREQTRPKLATSLSSSTCSSVAPIQDTATIAASADSRESDNSVVASEMGHRNWTDIKKELELHKITSGGGNGDEYCHKNVETSMAEEAAKVAADAEKAYDRLMAIGDEFKAREKAETNRIKIRIKIKDTDAEADASAAESKKDCQSSMAVSTLDAYCQEKAATSDDTRSTFERLDSKPTILESAATLSTLSSSADLKDAANLSTLATATKPETPASLYAKAARFQMPGSYSSENQSLSSSWEDLLGSSSHESGQSSQRFADSY